MIYWDKKDGNAEIMIEGMVTAGHDSDPFNVIEIMVPYNSISQQKIKNLTDQTKTFLDPEIRENTYRSVYRIIDRDKELIYLSGIEVKLVPIDLIKEERHEYVSIFLNFRTPLKSGETKAFRLTYHIQNFAVTNSSNFYGYDNLRVYIGFYDKSMIEHGNSILNDGSKVVNCKRIYVWCAFPVNFEDLGAAPPPQVKREWSEAFLSRGRKEYPKTLLSWEFDEFYPWMFRNRLSIMLRRRFLGILDSLGIIAFVLALSSIVLTIFGIFGPILSFGGL